MFWFLRVSKKRRKITRLFSSKFVNVVYGFALVKEWKENMAYARNKFVCE